MRFQWPATGCLLDLKISTPLNNYLCLEVQVVAFFVFACVWKLASEFLYVPAGAYGAWWEVIERGSSYAAPLLWIGFQRVLRVHGVAAHGLIPRRWRRLLGEG